MSIWIEQTIGFLQFLHGPLIPDTANNITITLQILPPPVTAIGVLGDLFNGRCTQPTLLGKTRKNLSTLRHNSVTSPYRNKQREHSARKTWGRKCLTNWSSYLACAVHQRAYDHFQTRTKPSQMSPTSAIAEALAGSIKVLRLLVL